MHTDWVKYSDDVYVSIPSRGFWFFEVVRVEEGSEQDEICCVSIPSRGFWFFEGYSTPTLHSSAQTYQVSIPSRGFWFFEGTNDVPSCHNIRPFQSPRGDFGFLKPSSRCAPCRCTCPNNVSIPSRGFWFFEGEWVELPGEWWRFEGFNPLAGILVF